jgi:DNA polymerase-3 subunit delta'
MQTKYSQPIVGNEKVIEFLQRLAQADQQEQLSGSYIFTGPSQVGKTSAVIFFLQSLLCKQPTIEHQPCGKCQVCWQINKSVYPDLVDVRVAEGKRDISIEQIRELINKLKLSSFANSYKIGIIHQAEKLNANSANALLKTLEEPNRKVLIFLITSDLDSLPQTIVSRSQVLRFNAVPFDLIYNYLITNHEAKRSQALHLARLAAGRPELAVELLADSGRVAKQALFADLFLSAFDQDVNARLASLDKAVGKLTGQEGVVQAQQILNIWQQAERDLWLVFYGQTDLVHYSNALEKLESLKNKITKRDLAGAQALLSQAKQYLFSNVNSKIALENVMINI